MFFDQHDLDTACRNIETYGKLEPRFSGKASVAYAHPLLGPVMCITPDKVHLSDPDNYEVIYSIDTKYAKSL